MVAFVAFVAFVALVAVNVFGSVGEGGVDVHLREAGWHKTTIGVLVREASRDRVGCRLLAWVAHGGLACSVSPSHRRFEVETLVAASEWLERVRRSVSVPSPPSVGE